jgi:3-hydroxybutyryl-CoA dehydrogenase
MNVDEIERIAVVGVGFIGHQIAQEFAIAGYTVHLHDVSDQRLTQALTHIQQNLETLVESDFLPSQQVQLIMDRFTPNPVLKNAVDDADIVIEAVYEDVTLKQDVFRQLDQHCPKRTILASNTSTFLPSLMASVTTRPEQVLVAHYINPPYLLPVVELVRCPETSDDTITTMYDMYKGMGKSPIVIQKEIPGFIVNRLQNAIFREALYLVEQGIASPQDVDTAIKDSFGRRLGTWGYFELCDLGGLDLILAAHQYLRPHLCSSTDVPPLLMDKVEKGELGVKTGKGFYEWTVRSPTETTLFQTLLRRLVQIAKWPKLEEPDKR